MSASSLLWRCESLESTPIPEWARRSWTELRARLTEDFPCVFAIAAPVSVIFVENLAEETDLEAIRAGFLDFLARLRALSLKETAKDMFVVMVAPATVPKIEEEYARDTWRVLQFLHDHDPSPWPADMPKNPAHPFWSFCFDGEPCFVNASSPAHTHRRSRNLGPGLVLAFQRRAGVDLLAPADRSGDATRRMIRARTEAYDAAPPLPMFGASGKPNLRDWKIYFLPNGEGPIPSRCPLDMKAGVEGRG